MSGFDNSFKNVVNRIINRNMSEITYGGMDGLMTIFSIISGAYGADFNINIIKTLSISTIFADAISMGISSYQAEKERDSSKDASQVGYITFASFLILGLIPIIPFFIIRESKESKWLSFKISYILFALLLFLLGYVKNNSIRTGLISLFIGMIGASVSFNIARYYQSK